MFHQHSFQIDIISLYSSFPELSKLLIREELIFKITSSLCGNAEPWTNCAGEYTTDDFWCLNGQVISPLPFVPLKRLRLFKSRCKTLAGKSQARRTSCMVRVTHWMWLENRAIKSRSLKHLQIDSFYLNFAALPGGSLAVRSPERPFQLLRAREHVLVRQQRAATRAQQRRQDCGRAVPDRCVKWSEEAYETCAFSG